MSKLKYYLSVGIMVVGMFSIWSHEGEVAAASCPGIASLTDPLAIKMENGQAILWDNVDPKLLIAKAQYEKLITAKGWTYKYTTVYRPYEYEQHLYDIANAPDNVCKQVEKKKHNISGQVAAPNMNSPHTRGIAFDAIIYNEKGKALTGTKFADPAVIALAKEAQLKIPSPTSHGVHHELISPTVTTLDQVMSAKGTITAEKGFNVRHLASEQGTKLGGVNKGEVVDIVAKNGDWYKIKYGNSYGYILAVKAGLTVVQASTPTVVATKLETSVNTTTAVASKPTTSANTATTVKEEALVAKGTITLASGFNVRSEANEKSTKIGVIAQHEVVDIVAKNGDWYKIKYSNNYGYIMAVKSGLQLVKEETLTMKAIVTMAIGFNVRSAADENAPKIGAVSKQTIVDIVAKSSDWYKIKYGNSYGYIKAVQTGIQPIQNAVVVKEEIFLAKGIVMMEQGLQVRSVASEQAISLGRVEKNEVVNIVAKRGDWYKLKYGNSQGYILALENGVQIISNMR